MKKISLLTLVALFGLLIVGQVARADDVEINLGSTSQGTLTFKGGNSASNILLVLSGITGDAMGQNALSGVTGFYGIGNNTLSWVSSTSNTSDWSVTGSELFCFTSAKGCGGTNYLTGTLSLLDAFQTNSVASTNTMLSADLTGLSGTYAGVFPGSGIVSLSLDLGSTTNLTTLLNQSSSKALTAGVSSGEVMAAPEPGSFLLLGIALLGAAVFVRKSALRNQRSSVAL